MMQIVLIAIALSLIFVPLFLLFLREWQQIRPWPSLWSIYRANAEILERLRRG